MAIRTSLGISGWVASEPQLTHTLSRARLYFRFGQSQHRRGESSRPPEFADLVVFGAEAEAAYRNLRNGDRFTAVGRLTTDENGRERFIADSIGPNGRNPHIRILHRPAAARALDEGMDAPSAGIDPVSR